MEIKNLKEAAERLSLAVKRNEQILIFSDADVDGVTSAIIVEEAIKNLNGNVSFIAFSDKESEDYGLSKEAIRSFSKYSPAVLVLLDLGIGNIKEIELAKEKGFEVIIIDHHEIIGKNLPGAEIIVDPKQEGDNYPFKELAACGLSLKLAKTMLGDKFRGLLKDSFFELAALGTITDKMPQLNDNLEIIRKGTYSFLKTRRPGLRILLDTFLDDGTSLREAIQRIGQLLQITPFDKKKRKVLAYSYLSLSEKDDAKEISKKLMDNYEKRRKELKKKMEKLTKEIETEKEKKFIFRGGKDIPFNFLGALASRLSSKFGKPAFIYAQNKQRIVGSVRTSNSMNSLESLSFCSKFLKTYGGHPPASGFNVKKGMVEKFGKCLEEYFNNKINE